MKNISIIIMGVLFATSSVQAMQTEYDEFELLSEIRSFLGEEQSQVLPVDDPVYSLEQVHTEKEGQGNDATELLSDITLAAESKEMSLDEDVKKTYEANPKQCPECEYSGKLSCDVRKHAARMHNRCLECKDCKRFDDRAAIIKHYKLNHPSAGFAKAVSKRVCEYCDKEILSRTYDIHLRNEHFRNDNAGYKASRKDKKKRKKRRIEESRATSSSSSSSSQTTTTSIDAPEVLAQAGNTLVSQAIAWLHTASQSESLQGSVINEPEKNVAKDTVSSSQTTTTSIGAPEVLAQAGNTLVSQAIAWLHAASQSESLQESVIDEPEKNVTEDTVCSLESIQTENDGNGDDATELLSDVTANVELDGMPLGEDIKKAYEANPKQCYECKYIGKSPWDVRIHAAGMHNYCLECKDYKRFDNKTAIRKHYEINHPNATFTKAMSRKVCEYCNKNIGCQSYKVHLRNQHFRNDNAGYEAFLAGIIEESGVAQTTTTSTGVPEVLAQAGNIPVPQTLAWVSAVRQNVSDEDVKRAYKADREQCPECEYNRKKSHGRKLFADIKRHAARRHNRCLECDDCKRFKNRVAIEEHYKQYHPKTEFAKKISKLICELCNKNIQYQSYNAHVRKIHFKNDNAGYEAFLAGIIEESGVVQTTTTSTHVPEVLAQARNALASQEIALLHTASQRTVLQESAINQPEKSVNALQELQQNSFTDCSNDLKKLNEELFGDDWTLE